VGAFCAHGPIIRGTECGQGRASVTPCSTDFRPSAAPGNGQYRDELAEARGLMPRMGAIGGETPLKPGSRSAPSFRAISVPRAGGTVGRVLPVISGTPCAGAAAASACSFWWQSPKLAVGLLLRDAVSFAVLDATALRWPVLPGPKDIPETLLQNPCW